MNDDTMGQAETLEDSPLARIRAERVRLAEAREKAEAKKREAVAAAAKKCMTSGRRAAAARTRALCIVAGTMTAGFGGESPDSPAWFSCDSDLALEVATAINRAAHRAGSADKFRAEVLGRLGPRL